MTEEWRQIPGVEGYYEASDRGRIRSVNRFEVTLTGVRRLRRGQSITCAPRPGDSRRRTCLHREGARTYTVVARLVLAAFVGPCPAGLEACHRNGDESDDRLVNLRWDTRASNAQDRVAHGADAHARRVRCPRGHLLATPNLSMAHLRRGQRNCLACNRASIDVCKAKKKGLAVDAAAAAAKHYARIMPTEVAAR